MYFSYSFIVALFGHFILTFGVCIGENVAVVSSYASCFSLLLMCSFLSGDSATTVEVFIQSCGISDSIVVLLNIVM